MLTQGRHEVRLAVICPSARAPFHGTVRAVSEVLTVDIDVLPALVIEQPRGRKFIDAEARLRFVAIERFARLPLEKQAKQLPQFYKNLSPRSMNYFVEGILSSYPRNILDTK